MNTNPGHPEPSPPTGEAVAVRVVYRGRRYRVYRTGEPVGAGTVGEYWPGRGLLGSYRKWLGHTHTERLYWFAAINPTGGPYAATEVVEDLPSRRAALDWLFNHTTNTTGAGAELADTTGKD